MNDVNAVVSWIIANQMGLLGIAASLYTLLTLVVKICPTLDEGWLLNVIKFLAALTNRQTNDKAIREAKKTVTKP